MAVIGKPNVGKSSLVNRILGEERVIVSARSLSATNVQVIVEALGGGGNAGAAGAQIPGRTVEEVLDQLYAALDNYFDDQDGETPDQT